MTGAGLNADADNIISLGKQGHVHQVSVGGDAKMEFVEPGCQVQCNDVHTVIGPAYIAHDFTLREISVVTIGAAENTFLHIQTEQQTMTNTQPAQTDQTNIEQAWLIDRRRIAAIEKIGGGKLPELEAQAIEMGWSVEKFHGEYQHQTMPDASKVPVTGTRQSSGMNTTKIIEASFLQSAGMHGDRLLQMGYDERTIDAATDRRFRGETIQTLLRKSANDGSIQFSDTTIRMAYENMRYGNMQASFSTISILGILSNATNKLLMNGYQAIDDPTPLLSKDINANDFKEISLYQLVINGDMELVAADGEIKHASLSETPYKAKAETRGAMLGISRETIINDDMGMIADIFVQMGRKVISTKQKIWFRKFLENISKISAVPGNPALSLDSLQNMIAEFDSRTDAAGDLILANGKYLLVPPTLWGTATILLKTLVLDGQQAVALSTNPIFGSLNVEKSPFLGPSTKLPGASNTAFYMFSDPLAIAAMGTVYLKGNRDPIIETFDCDVNTLGMSTRCFFDYGVAFLDPNGVSRSEGTGE